MRYLLANHLRVHLSRLQRSEHTRVTREQVGHGPIPRAAQHDALTQVSQPDRHLMAPECVGSLPAAWPTRRSNPQMAAPNYLQLDTPLMPTAEESKYSDRNQIFVYCSEHLQRNYSSRRKTVHGVG
jgi:hypothetical protein